MNCINFDARFERFVSEWMQQNAAAYKNNLDRMEAKMPEVYLQWLNKPADWLDGRTPGDYFTQYSDAAQLVSWMLEYFSGKVPVPDQLLERLTALGHAAEEALLPLLENADIPEEARLTAITLLSEMESRAPLARYIAWITAAAARDERAEMAAEALSAMDASVVSAVLDAVSRATEHGREIFLDVLCNFPGDPRIYDLAISLFRARPERRALFASLLAKLGDDRAIPALAHALEDSTLPYLDYIELRNALEALGAEVPEDRAFDGDPAWESLRRME